MRFGIWKTRAHLVGIATRRPAFIDPFVGVLLGNNVHELLGADVIGNEMPARSDPLDMAGRLKDIRRNIVAVEQSAPDHLAGIGRVIVAVERPPDHGTHTVSRDHVFRLDASAVIERKHRRVVLFFYAGEAMSEVNVTGIESGCERIQQVGAMERVVGSAISLAGLESIVEFEELTGVHVPGVNSGRRVADSGNLFAATDGAQRLHGLWADVNGGAYFA